ncbi:MAG: DHH family phosphoesterase [Atopobiaceae bacterium]|jgi:manganese-dependent inorganic pyrophosphatase|nr:DHH family phosphoesterase [Atopobiaceae bacterium]
MSTVFVFGHKHPDNDAILSSVMLSQLLNQTNDGNLYVPRRLGEMPDESAAILRSWDFPEPELLEEIPAAREGEERQKVILTDHNEEVQSVHGLRNADIVGVVDHHRIANFQVASPIFFVTLPWGSSCSIVRYLFKAYGFEPTVAQASCLLAAMMTDTVMLKSPTTTDVDRRYVREFGERLGLDPVDFGMNIFMNRATGLYTPDQMVSHDIKAFEINGKRVFIGQYETVDKSAALGKIPQIREAMERFRKAKNGDTLVLCITDILEEGSQVLMCGDTSLPRRGLGIADAPEGVWIPGVLSRKKQVAAPIIAASGE